jgi:hypothetical protein
MRFAIECIVVVIVNVLFIHIVADIRIKRARKLAIMSDTEFKDLKLTLKEVDKKLFSYDTEEETLWCNYHNITLFFESKFGLKWEDIRDICGDRLEEHLKCKVDTIWNHDTTDVSKWDCYVKTPHKNNKIL